MAKQKTSSAKSDPAHFKRIADYVQQTRRNKRLSVRKVAQLSNLPESTIRALENPRKSDLPKSNVAGLYRVYAEALEISPVRIKKLIGDFDEPKPEFSLKRLPKLKSLVVFSNVGAVVAVVAILGVVLAYAVWQGLGLVAAPALSVEFPEQEYMVVDQSSVEVRGTAERESTVLVNGQPTTVNSESGSFSQLVFLQEGYNYVTIEVANSFSTTSTETYVIIYQPGVQSAFLRI